MTEASATVLALAGDGEACARLAAALWGEAAMDTGGAVVALGGRRYRLAGGAAEDGSFAFLARGVVNLDAAVLVIDADRGLTIEARAAAFVLHLLDRNVIVAVSDEAEDGERFAAAAKRCAAYLQQIGLSPRGVVPLAVADPGMAPSWHRGPSLAEALSALPPSPSSDLPLRISLGPDSDSDGRRLRGRVECGRLAVGDTLLLSPANRSARLSALLDPASGEPKTGATAGEAVELVLETPIPVSPGQLASHADTPPVETDVFRAKLLWAGLRPFAAGGRYGARLRGVEHPVTVQSIERIVSTPDFAEQHDPSAVAGDIVECVLRVPELVALDPFERCPPTGWLALYEGDEAVAAGSIGMQGYADQRDLITVRATNLSRAGTAVAAEARSRRNGHRGGILWLTGLSGAGKSTIAVEAERRLFAMGYQVCVLDGDNLRHGLSADLGFSPEDRSENIRRIGEVGALFARAGMIAITAFISPYRSDRDRARAAFPEAFAEIYVRATLATCEARDTKGLYKKARAGEIPEFTGISAPYEAPESPELVIDTDSAGIDSSVEVLLGYIETNYALTRPSPVA